MAKNHDAQLQRHEALCQARQEGQFTDIQTYKRAHGQDVKRKSKAERKKRIKVRNFVPLLPSGHESSQGHQA